MCVGRHEKKGGFRERERERERGGRKSLEHTKQEAAALKTAQLLVEARCFPAYEQSLVYFGVPLISKCFKYSKVL